MKFFFEIIQTYTYGFAARTTRIGINIPVVLRHPSIEFFQQRLAFAEQEFVKFYGSFFGKVVIKYFTLEIKLVV